MDVDEIKVEVLLGLKNVIYADGVHDDAPGLSALLGGLPVYDTQGNKLSPDCWYKMKLNLLSTVDVPKRDYEKERKQQMRPSFKDLRVRHIDYF